VAEFDALMIGYRLAQESDQERLKRSRVIDEATVTATRGPLGLAEDSVIARPSRCASAGMLWLAPWKASRRAGDGQGDRRGRGRVTVPCRNARAGGR
jgi:hypothetical protein